MWAATAASYCPSRPGELPKFISTKYRPQPDVSPCLVYRFLTDVVLLLYPYKRGIFESSSESTFVGYVGADCVVEALGAVVAVVGVLDDFDRGPRFIVATFDVVEAELS